LRLSAGRTTASRLGIPGLAKSKFFEYVFDKVSESNEEREIFSSRIFGLSNTADIGVYANTAYYAGFRYSTLEGRIVQSFLAVLAPGDNKQDFVSFVHVVKGDHKHDVKKVTKGIVINLAPATYFLGRTLRDDAATVSNLEVITIERDTLLAKAPVLHALIKSSAAVNQPIVARMVLVKIGDRIGMARKVNDSDFETAEFDDHLLSARIKSLLRKSQNIGQPARKNEAKSRSKGDKAAVIEKLVRDGMNNIPRPALIRAIRVNLKSRKRRPLPSNEGAIEVWGREPRP
jgi:hypothetical protein